jgi:hypothetical protein
MKKVFLALSLGVLLGITATAQTTPATVKQKIDDKYERVSGITDAQKAKLQQIKADAKAKRDQLKSNTTLSAADKNKQIEALNEQEHQQRLAVLTPAQQQELKQAHKAAKIIAAPAVQTAN